MALYFIIFAALDCEGGQIAARLAQSEFMEAMANEGTGQVQLDICSCDDILAILDKTQAFTSLFPEGI